MFEKFQESAKQREVSMMKAVKKREKELARSFAVQVESISAKYSSELHSALQQNVPVKVATVAKSPDSLSPILEQKEHDEHTPKNLFEDSSDETDHFQEEHVGLSQPGLTDTQMHRMIDQFRDEIGMNNSCYLESEQPMAPLPRRVSKRKLTLKKVSSQQSQDK